jgi:hypothetical protein
LERTHRMEKGRGRQKERPDFMRVRFLVRRDRCGSGGCVKKGLCGGFFL